MVRRGVAVEDLAGECGVDPKTVERWISSGRVPHRRHRWATARRLGAEEAYLWPDVLASVANKRGEASRAELIEVFPDRASVPRETWLRLLSEAQERVDVLVFSGTFSRRYSHGLPGCSLIVCRPGCRCDSALVTRTARR